MSQPSVYPHPHFPTSVSNAMGSIAKPPEIRHDSRSVTTTVMGLSKLTIDMINPPLSPIETAVSSRCQTQIGHR